MSKAVLISIRPKWCEKIANGEKTIEVRKTRPKLDTPFKCYIYCTLQGCNEFFRVDLGGDVAKWNRGKWWHRKGKVIGEFTCDRIVPITYDGGRLWCPTNAAFSPATCLSQTEIIAYIGDKGRCYGWHISDLRIYDTPCDLGEFSPPLENCIGKVCDEFGCASCENGGHIKRPPQSWCYVEDLQTK